MRDLFLSGHIVDLILALIALEAVVVLAWRRNAHRSLDAIAFLAGLIPGAFLLLAVRAALSGAWWGWVAAALAAAGLSHVADLAFRLRAA